MKLKSFIHELHDLNRVLVGGDNEEVFKILNRHIHLNRIIVPSGTSCFTWKVPQKWYIKKGRLLEKKTKQVICDYEKNPLHIFVGSLPFTGDISYKELLPHLRYNKTFPKAIPYIFPYYDLKWGFSMSYNQFKKLNKKSRYLVEIDTKYASGNLEIGEVVVPGKTKNELLLIAHYDHPFQSNDNLSGVAVALAAALHLQKKIYNHTIKILFLPETIGSIAYAWKRQKNLKNIKAVLVLDIVGNQNRLLIQKTLRQDHYLNAYSRWVADDLGMQNEVAEYREKIGSDEMIFNDPLINVPAVMISTWPYPEYHTHFDAPEIISENMLQSVNKFVLNWLEILDQNIVAKRLWKGPLMRSSIDWFLGKQPQDRQLELLGYQIDGSKSVIELALEINMDIRLALDYVYSLKHQGLVSFLDN